MRTIALAAILAIPACTYNPPAPERPIAEAATGAVRLPYDQAWNKALSVLTESGYPITVAAKESGVITTGSKPVRLTESQVDCGNIWGLPYVKDKRTTTNVRYSLKLSAAGDSTRVAINSTVQGNFVSHAGATSLSLDCRSLGDIEAALLRRLSQ